MFRRTFKACSIVLICVPNILAKDSGITGANLLKIEIDPAARAMGNFSAGLLDSALSSLQNPAGLAALQHPELSLVHTNHIEDIQEQCLAYAHPVKNTGTFSFSAIRLGMDKFQGYDADGKKTTMIAASDISIKTAWAKSFFGKTNFPLDAGIELGYLQERLAGVNGNSYEGGAGIKLNEFPWLGRYGKGTKAGFSIQHIGKGLTFDDSAGSLPTVYRAGLYNELNILNDSLVIGLGTTKYRDSAFELNAGAQYCLAGILKLRLGWKNNKDIGPGFRAGMGFRVRLVQLDYSWDGYGALGDTHTIALTIKFAADAFDSIKNSKSETMTIYQKGLELYRIGKYPEAIIELNKVLEREPENKDAMEKLREAYGKMKEE